MAREGQGYPCYQRDMMMMMIYIYIYIYIYILLNNFVVRNRELIDLNLNFIMAQSLYIDNFYSC